MIHYFCMPLLDQSVFAGAKDTRTGALNIDQLLQAVTAVRWFRARVKKTRPEARLNPGDRLKEALQKCWVPSVVILAKATHRKWEMSRDDCMDAGDRATQEAQAEDRESEATRIQLKQLSTGCWC